MGKMTFSAEVDQEEVLSSVVDNLDQDELESFIKSIDGRVGDWDFTKKLYAYFRNEMRRGAADGLDPIEAVDKEIDGSPPPASSEGGDEDDDEDTDDDEEDDDEDDDVEEEEEMEEDGKKEAAKRRMGEWG